MRALREARSGDIAFFGVGGEAMEAEGLKSLFPIGDIAVMGILPVLARLPTPHRAHPRDRGGDRGRQARRARHHRQSRLHPPRRPPRARGAAGTADRRLCQPERLGLAARPRQGDAILRRLRAGAAAVRAGRVSAAGRPALRLCRPSADRAPRRAAAERGRGAPPRRRAAAHRRAARLAPIRGQPADGGFRRRARRRCANRSGRSRSFCRPCRISSARCAPWPRIGPSRRRSRSAKKRNTQRFAPRARASPPPAP